MKFLILNGPNMNFLGIREKEIYGEKTYDDLISFISSFAKEKGVEVEFFQSNCEGSIIDAIQNAYFSHIDGIVFNPAGYTHTSISIFDALKSVSIPTVEVHISDLEKREDFRKVNFIKKACVHSVCGKGFLGYTEAIDFLMNYLGGNNAS